MNLPAARRSCRFMMRAICALTILSLWTAVPLEAGEGSPALYRGLKPDAFMKRWLVLSPIPVSTNRQPDETTQQAAFNRDFLKPAGGESSIQPSAGQAVQIDGTDYRWRLVEADRDVVDLSAGEEGRNFVVAYAWAEVELDRAATLLFGLGSDDALRVWLNGKLVHEKWAGRPARKDDDLVELSMQKGRNRLLCKVQNALGSWELVCRPLGPAAFSEKLVAAAGQGDLDGIKKLLSRGVKVHGPDRHGVTPWQAAKIHGHKEAADFLRTQGARARLPEKPERVADKAFAEIVHDGGSGAAVLVAQHGKILFAKGYGLANLEHRVAVTPETKFRIGSISKQFTASAILKLHEQGKLSLDDTLSKFFPDFPRGGEVTIHHLLTHTSGIHSYTSKPDFFETAPLFIKPQALIQSFQNDPYDFDPGTRWSYNNSGYFLLGAIVEKISGTSYGEFLRTTFFGPLGMTNTGVHQGTEVIAHEAHGYAFDRGKFKKALNWDMSRAGGAGSLYSTVRDLYRWNEALFHRKVLNPASLTVAFTPAKTRENASENLAEGYGYGWGIAKMRGLTQISHGGGLHGFSSYLLRIPEQELTVIVLANASPSAPGLDPAMLANELTQLYLADKLEWRPILEANKTVSPKTYDAYVGRYDYGPIMTITREDDRLFAQLAGRPKHEIFPRSETEFFWKVVDAQVTFVKDEKGAVTKAIHRQGGQTIHAARLPDLTVVRIDPALLNAYTGRYDYGGGNAILTVTREGNRLFAQLTGQPKFEIFPKSDTEFVWKDVAAQVTFVKDEAGKVTKGIHQQGGQKFDAPKIE